MSLSCISVVSTCRPSGDNIDLPLVRSILISSWERFLLVPVSILCVILPCLIIPWVVPLIRPRRVSLIVSSIQWCSIVVPRVVVQLLTEINPLFIGGSGSFTCASYCFTATSFFKTKSDKYPRLMSLSISSLSTMNSSVEWPLYL